MDRLCGRFIGPYIHNVHLFPTDEITQLIFYELQNPTSFTQVSKRFYELSQDPYVRAHYFLARHGQLHAMYWALGRGRILTDKVIDVCSPHPFRLLTLFQHHQSRSS